MKKMKQKEKITEIINILHLLTKRVKKIEVDILKASNKNKVVDVLDDEEVATRLAYIKQRNGL
jgi:hypothetical protein